MSKSKEELDIAGEVDEVMQICERLHDIDSGMSIGGATARIRLAFERVLRRANLAAQAQPSPSDEDLVWDTVDAWIQKSNEHVDCVDRQRLCSAIAPLLAQVRREALEKAAAKAEEMGKYVSGGYNNAAHEIAEAIRSLKERG